MTVKLSIFEQLEFSTTRITCSNDAGNKQYGTGFFYTIKLGNGKIIQVVLTNKHVILGMKYVLINISQADYEGNPIYAEPHVLRIDLKSELVFYHPNQDVDLCAIAVGPVLNALYSSGRKFFFRAFDDSLIPSKNQIKELDSIEDILMIGYPNALWDEKNNMPLVRKGITATPAWLDYNGKKEFVIDAACFPGSSGSPVLICNIGSFKDKFGAIRVGTSRIYLLGLLYGGPQLTVEGEICIKTMPDAQKQPYAVSSIPNNLGYVIKSERIIELSNYIISRNNG